MAPASTRREVNGGNGAEAFTVTANGARVRFDRVTPAPFSIDIGTTEKLVVNMNGGDDTFSATGNLAALISLTVDGGGGNDTILGGNGADFLFGGDGNDFIDGNQGNDVAFLGAGDDIFQWDPGDGADVVEGQAGTDTMLFNGSGANEIFELSANGERAPFHAQRRQHRHGHQRRRAYHLKALGGTDTVTVNDLSRHGCHAGGRRSRWRIGGTAGDGAADTVVVNGTNGGDTIDIVGAGSRVSVVGGPARVNVTARKRQRHSRRQRPRRRRRHLRGDPPGRRR